MIDFIKKYQSYFKVGLLLLVIAFVAQFIYHTDVRVIMEYLKKMPFTFIGVVGLSFCAYMSASIAWKLCLGDHSSKVGIGYLFVTRHVGEMLSVFNPTSVIAGEALKVHYLSKVNIPKADSISSILLSRVLIILSALFLMMLSVVYLISKGVGGAGSPWFMLLGVLTTLVFGYLLTRFLLHSKLFLFRSVSSLQRRFGKKFFSDKLTESIREINESMYLFYNQYKLRFYIAFVLCVIHWILGAAEFYLVLRVLGLDVSVIDAISVEMGVIFFKSIGAMVPGQVGVEEYANKIMLDAVGVMSNEIWLVVSIMRRARQLFWVAVAALFYSYLRKKLPIEVDTEDVDG